MLNSLTTDSHMTLKKGMTGLHVQGLQELLHIYPDGKFGPLTEEAVKEFQKAHGLVADGIVGEKTWAALKSAEKGELKKSTRTINEIIVHCSATPEGKDYTLDTIRQWHLQRGFSDIGYHYIIHPDGLVEEGRDVNIAGAHCSGHNSKSIGICYIGGMTADNKKAKDTRTDAQKVNLKVLLQAMRKLYPNAKIHGHRDFAAKDCPSFDATEEYKNI